MGIAHQKIGQQRCKSGTEEHGIDICQRLVFFQKICHHNTQDGEPHIQNIDTPAAEAQGQQECQRGNIVDCGLGQRIQQRHGQSHQCHIQKGCSITANGEIVGGNLCRTHQNLPQAGEHGCPVRHKNCCHQACHSEKREKQFQKIAFRKIFDFFHNYLFLL